MGQPGRETEEEKAELRTYAREALDAQWKVSASRNVPQGYRDTGMSILVQRATVSTVTIEDHQILRAD